MLFLSLSFFLVTAGLIAWIWVIVHILSGEFRDTGNKLGWLLLVLFLPVVGSIIYLVFGRQERIDRLEEYV